MENENLTNFLGNPGPRFREVRHGTQRDRLL
jgi:hypothetical protein